MSLTPPFFSSFSTLSQNFALSLSPTVMLSTSLCPSSLFTDPEDHISSVLADDAFAPDIEDDCVYVHDGIHGAQRAFLPLLDLRQDLVRYGCHHGFTDFKTIDFHDLIRDLAVVIPRAYIRMIFSSISEMSRPFSAFPFLLPSFPGWFCPTDPAAHSEYLPRI